MTATETINAILREKLAELLQFTEYATIHVELSSYAARANKSARFQVYAENIGLSGPHGDLDVAIAAVESRIKNDTPAARAASLREQAAKLMAEAESLEA